ncbi:hypothetical protein HDC90_004536 [Pedobacter sp. AK013]|uniref:hypothetical protein n=1 Tax=Pedobacter sp. AK013 TaxID=2723071 RepID=UPI00160CD95D|nr:hypothetical protein [Pedobacter sp. AK013]MBB6239874.1 hypothetical protein [Pedobacter sp. AK013]
MNKAIIKDIEKKYIEAVKCYEEEINGNSHPDINCFINLAFLYWSFATEQIEFNEPNKIPEEWSLIGGENFLPTLDKGLENYPGNLELIFWKQYLSYRLYMTDFSENDCKSLIKQYGNENSLVPYFFLYLFDEKSHSEKINELRKICKGLPTAKNIYISSFIEN